jgi:protein O-GlcNAc transferase
VLPAPRPGLRTVPLPQLDSVEAPVVRQMHESHQTFAALVERSNVPDTDLAEAYGALGQLYHAYGFLDAAETCYRNAIRLAPGDFRWLHLLGYMSHQGGRLQDAVSLYSAALKSRPDDFPVLIYLGEVFLRLNRQAEAKHQFNAALPKYPAAALNGLGEAALLERRFEQAVQHFEAALHRVPQASRLHYSLAMAYRGLGRLEQAQFHLRQVGPASIQPADPVVDALPNFLVGERANLIHGQLAYQGGQFKTAAAAFAKALHAAPMSISASVNLGLALAKLGDTEGAIQRLRAALQLDSQNVTALLTLGRLLAYQGRHAEAVDHFRAVIKHDPNHVEANLELRDSLLKLKTQSRPQSESS